MQFLLKTHFIAFNVNDVLSGNMSIHRGAVKEYCDAQLNHFLLVIFGSFCSLFGNTSQSVASRFKDVWMSGLLCKAGVPFMRLCLRLFCISESIVYCCIVVSPCMLLHLHLRYPYVCDRVNILIGTHMWQFKTQTQKQCERIKKPALNAA